MKKLIAALFTLALLTSLTACGLQPHSVTEVTDMAYELQYQEQSYAGLYTGNVSEMAPDGEGVFSYDDGERIFIYDGAWVTGEISGPGRLSMSHYLIKFPDVDRYGHYEGEVIDGVPNGNGSFTATNEEGYQYCYTGQFSDGAFNGQGARRFEEDPSADEIGTFTNNAFTPTPLEAFINLGQLEEGSYIVSENAKSFLEKHSTFFSGKMREFDEYLDAEWRPEAFSKNPDKFGDRLVKVENLTIIQIFEFEYYNYDAVTFIVASDANYNYYSIYYLNSVKAFDGDIVSMYALPVDFSTYETVGGGHNWAIVCAAAFIE